MIGFVGLRPPSLMSDSLKTVRVGGFETVRAERKELAAWIAETCEAARATMAPSPPRLVFSSNGQGIAIYGQDPAYDAAMDAADIIHADGMSVVMASRVLTRRPIAERSATTDLFHDLAKEAEGRGLTFYVLGGKEEENLAAVNAMLDQYPGLRIVGRQNGYFADSENDAVCAKIVAARPDILWVGLGKPKQEIWSHQNREVLAGVGCIKTCGGLYAFLSGASPRAPAWMQVAGLEWLYRLIQEPRRLFWRYLVTNAKSSWRLLGNTR